MAVFKPIRMLRAQFSKMQSTLDTMGAEEKDGEQGQEGPATFTGGSSGHSDEGRPEGRPSSL